MNPFELSRLWFQAFAVLFVLMVGALVLSGLGIGGGWEILALLALLAATPFSMVKGLAVDRWAKGNSADPSLFALANRSGLTRATGFTLVVLGVFLLLPRIVPQPIGNLLQAAGLVTVIVGLGLSIWGHSLARSESKSRPG